MLGPLEKLDKDPMSSEEESEVENYHQRSRSKALPPPKALNPTVHGRRVDYKNKKKVTLLCTRQYSGG